MSRLLAISLLLTLCGAPSVLAQASPPRVSALEWMAGTWVYATAQGKVTETWLGPGNGLMIAANLSTWSNGKKSFEFLRIGETADGISYFASPGGRAPVEFKVKEFGDRKVVFENSQHDFPQRILYWRDGDALLARIEGMFGGKERSQEWKFLPAR